MTEARKSPVNTLNEGYETFLERAAHEPDPDFAEDLYLGAQIAAELQDSGGLALAVGGYARDSVLARLRKEPLDSKDIDMEVYGLEFDELTSILEAYGNVDLVGASFGIAKVKNPTSGNMLDFSIPRRDSKIDKGHKGFKVTGDPTMTVEEAAQRRDLTINALALNPLTGEMTDNYRGIRDLLLGELRATDSELFKDDPLRVLRVMQFAGRFNFRVDPETSDICRSLDLTELPDERIGEEWTKLMTKSERPSVGLKVARDLGVFDQLHPELAAVYDSEHDRFGQVWEHTKRAVDIAANTVRNEDLVGEDERIVLFGALCLDLRKTSGEEPTRRFLRSLKIRNDTIAKILPIVTYSMPRSSARFLSDKEAQQFAKGLHPASIRLWDLVSRADANLYPHEIERKSASYTIYQQAVRLGVAELPAPAIVQGRDLIAHLGMKPGPHFREILDLLYDAQLGDHFKTIEEGIAYYKASQPSMDLSE